MKIVKSKGDAFDFKLSGTETITVTPEGFVTTDEVANILDTRCGVTVEQAPDDAVAEVPVAKPVEEVIPADPAPVEVEVPAPVEVPVDAPAEVPPENPAEVN
jgi:hypothetical protein